MKTVNEDCVLKPAVPVGNGGFIPQGDWELWQNICFRIIPPEGQESWACMCIPTPRGTSGGLFQGELAVGSPCTAAELPFTGFFFLLLF